MPRERRTFERSLFVQFCHDATPLVRSDDYTELLANASRVGLVVAAENLGERPQRERTVLLQVRGPERVDGVAADVVEMGRKDAGEEVRGARLAHELEESRKGVLRGALAARDVGLLRQSMQSEGALQQRMTEDLGRQ